MTLPSSGNEDLRFDEPPGPTWGFDDLEKRFRPFARRGACQNGVRVLDAGAVSCGRHPR